MSVFIHNTRGFCLGDEVGDGLEAAALLHVVCAWGSWSVEERASDSPADQVGPTAPAIGSIEAAPEFDPGAAGAAEVHWRNHSCDCKSSAIPFPVPAMILDSLRSR